VLKPEVRILGDASLARIHGISAAGTFAFDGQDAAIDALAANDVLAGGIAPATPTGMLREALRVGDHREQAQTALAPRTREDVEAERLA